MDGHQIAMALRSAYLAMHRQSEAFFQTKGLTASQYVLLSQLADQDEVSQAELVRRTSSDPNTVRQVLLSMEAKGFLKRVPDPLDGRVRLVKLSKKGRRVFESARDGSEFIREKLRASLSDRDAKKVVDLLGRVAEAMQNSTG